MRMHAGKVVSAQGAARNTEQNAKHTTMGWVGGLSELKIRESKQLYRRTPDRADTTITQVINISEGRDKGREDCQSQRAYLAWAEPAEEEAPSLGIGASGIDVVPHCLALDAPASNKADFVKRYAACRCS